MVALKFSTLHILFLTEHTMCTALSNSALLVQGSLFYCGKRSLKGFQRGTLSKVTTFSSCPIFLDLNFSTEDFRYYKKH